jgi:hypothetical protein
MATNKKKTIDIHISPRLVNILEKFSVKSEIARMLLKVRFNKEDLVDDPIDFISISKEDPTKFTYLTPEKIYKAGTNDVEELWGNKSKIAAKPAVAIKKLFKEVHEKDVELFTTLFKAAVSQKDFELKLIQGEDMVKYYSYKSYQPEISGTLHNSCMKHDHCYDYFDIYTKNPEICTMLVMLDSRGLLLGRTLLWNAIDLETGSEVKVMDRIYCVDDSKNMHYFKEWADENGYIYKKEQRWQNSMFFESHGVTSLRKIHVNIKKKPFVKYPYVDTFKFWDEKKSIICNYLPSDNGYIRTLMGNDGRTLGGDVLGLDTIQNLYVHREHLIYLPYIDGRIHADHSIWSETMQTSIAREHAIYSEEIKDYIFKEEWSKFNDTVRFNARKEQIRRLNEQKSKKMVSSRRARSSNSEYYNGAYYNPNDFGNGNNDVVFDFIADGQQRPVEIVEDPVEQPVVAPVAAHNNAQNALFDVAINDLWTDFTQRRNNRNRGRVTVRRTEDPVVEQIQPEVPAVEPAANPALAINNNTVLDQLLIELEQAVNNINNG